MEPSSEGRAPFCSHEFKRPSQLVSSERRCRLSVQIGIITSSRPPTVISTGPVILKIFNDAVLPTIVKIEPMTTQTRGEKSLACIQRSFGLVSWIQEIIFRFPVNVEELKLFCTLAFPRSWFKENLSTTRTATD